MRGRIAGVAAVLLLGLASPGLAAGLGPMGPAWAGLGPMGPAWAGLGPMGPAWAGPLPPNPCALVDRVFAVDAVDGHLDELGRCGGGFREPVPVGSGDWRIYRQVAMVPTPSGAVVMYAAGFDGSLWWRKQDAPGAAVGPAVRIGESIDWGRLSAFAVPAAGWLHASDGVSERTFRHAGWDTGDPVVTEEAPLLLPMLGPGPIAVTWGAYGEGIAYGKHFRVWRQSNGGEFWRVVGVLPAGVTRVAGAEPNLYGIDGQGRVARLRDAVQPEPEYCDEADTWVVSGWSPVGRAYASVIAPSGRPGAASPQLAPPPTTRRPCLSDEDPYEWH